MSSPSAVPGSVPGVATPDPLTMREVMRIVPMRRMWYAQTVSIFGDFLALYAVITYMTFTLHATATQVTGIQIAYLLPIAVLGILAGVFVDRWHVKPTLVASDVIRAFFCLGLLFVTSAMGFYAVLFGISIVSSFFGPAQGKVAIRSVVPLHGLRSAQLAHPAGHVHHARNRRPGRRRGMVTAWFGARSCYLH